MFVLHVCVGSFFHPELLNKQEAHLLYIMNGSFTTEVAYFLLCQYLCLFNKFIITIARPPTGHIRSDQPVEEGWGRDRWSEG